MAALALLAVLPLTPWRGSLAAQGEPYAVIVSPDVPITDLSLEELRRLFLFRSKFWKPGQPVRIIFSEDAIETGSLLLRRVYRLDAPGLRRMILEKLYQGEIDLAPKVVASDKLVVDYVAAGQGIISVVPAAAVQQKPVKVLTVGGSLPGAEGYPLTR